MWSPKAAPTADRQHRGRERGEGAADDSGASREVTIELWEAVVSLPDKQREVLVLRFYLDWSTERIAGALELPTARSRAGYTPGCRRCTSIRGVDDPIARIELAAPLRRTAVRHLAGDPPDSPSSKDPAPPDRCELKPHDGRERPCSLPEHVLAASGVTRALHQRAESNRRRGRIARAFSHQGFRTLGR
jgi:hypothetical protein